MDTIETAPTAVAGQLPRLPLRLHHSAFPVRDHERNRHFLEDVLGIPLVATWCEKSFSRELGRDVDFFQFADPELFELTQAEKPPKVGRYDHIAFKVEKATYEDLKQRLTRAAEDWREANHGYCRSIYVTSPDGLNLEFTEDPPDVDEIAAMRKADAHSELARWLAGDRHVNNELRHRDF
jgi:glyoxylase I family protein